LRSQTIKGKHMNRRDSLLFHPGDGFKFLSLLAFLDLFLLVASGKGLVTSSFADIGRIFSSVAWSASFFASLVASLALIIPTVQGLLTKFVHLTPLHRFLWFPKEREQADEKWLRENFVDASHLLSFAVTTNNAVAYEKYQSFMQARHNSERLATHAFGLVVFMTCELTFGDSAFRQILRVVEAVPGFFIGRTVFFGLLALIAVTYYFGIKEGLDLHCTSFDERIHLRKHGIPSPDRIEPAGSGT
jgi:hypothetical protein